MKERRRDRRHVPQSEVYGKIKATVPARIIDISAHGVQVEVESGLRPAVECDISLPTGGGTIRVRARVQRCRAASMDASQGAELGLVYRAGLEFVDVKDADARALEAAYGFAAGIAAAAGGKKRRRRSGPIKIRINPDDILKRRD